MVSQTKTKIAKVGSRHTIYLEKAFVEDSAFPFKPDEPLTVKLDKNRLFGASDNIMRNASKKQTFDSAQCPSANHYQIDIFFICRFRNDPGWIPLGQNSFNLNSIF